MPIIRWIQNIFKWNCIYHSNYILFVSHVNNNLMTFKLGSLTFIQRGSVSENETNTHILSKLFVCFSKFIFIWLIKHGTHEYGNCQSFLGLWSYKQIKRELWCGLLRRHRLGLEAAGTHLEGRAFIFRNRICPVMSNGGGPYLGFWNSKQEIAYCCLGPHPWANWQLFIQCNVITLPLAAPYRWDKFLSSQRH